jgi:hypothetical protein
MTYTVKIKHESGLTHTSTTLTNSSEDLALAFVIYREKIKKYPNKSIILSNDIEYKGEQCER